MTNGSSSPKSSALPEEDSTGVRRLLKLLKVKQQTCLGWIAMYLKTCCCLVPSLHLVCVTWAQGLQSRQDRRMMTSSS